MARISSVAALLVAIFIGLPVCGGEVRMVERRPDPYGRPRPSRGATQVPLRTSLYFELELAEAQANDQILPDSLTVEIQAGDSATRKLLLPQRQFAAPARGWLRPRSAPANGWAVYVDPGVELQPAATYTVRAAVRSREGVELSAKNGTWSFTTEAEAQEHAMQFALDLTHEPIRWHGGKGSPCDLISIHAYNRSEVMAAKLIRAKEIALEVDADWISNKVCASSNAIARERRIIPPASLPPVSRTSVSCPPAAPAHWGARRTSSAAPAPKDSRRK